MPTIVCRSQGGDEIRLEKISYRWLLCGTATHRVALRRLVAEHDRNEITEQATGEHAHEELDRW
jgi:hypothetical protein